MTEDTIISLGIQAESILKDDAFNDLFKFIIDDTARSILATTIDESDKRETLYATVNGMRYFVDKLNQLSIAKTNIADKQNHENDENPDIF